VPVIGSLARSSGNGPHAGHSKAPPAL